MQLSPVEYARLSAQAKTNRDVKKLLEFYHAVSEEQCYEVFVAMTVTLNNWTQQLIDNNISIFANSSDAADVALTDKDVDRALKLMQALPGLVEGKEKIRQKLTEEELKELTNDKRIKKSEDLPFTPADAY